MANKTSDRDIPKIFFDKKEYLKPKDESLFSALHQGEYIKVDSRTFFNGLLNELKQHNLRKLILQYKKHQEQVKKMIQTDKNLVMIGPIAMNTLASVVFEKHFREIGEPDLIKPLDIPREYFVLFPDEIKAILNEVKSESGQPDQTGEPGKVTEQPETKQEQKTVETISAFSENIIDKIKDIKSNNSFDKRLKQFKVKPLESWNKLFVKISINDDRIYINNHGYSPSEIGFKPRVKGGESKYFIYFKSILYIMDRINKGEKIPNGPIVYNKRNLNAINSKIKSLTGLDTGIPIQYLNGMFKINFKFQVINND